MLHELICRNVSKHIDLTPAEEAHFSAMLIPHALRRKEFFLQEGEICKHSVFVVKGCLRGYTVDSNGFEHILQFAPPDWWIADMYSLLSGRPGNLNIDALEDSEVLLLAKKDQEQLYHDVPKFERFFRIITENALVTSRQRVLDNLSLSAQQRYEAFCQRYPTLINYLPQKQIASYIGVTPEFLSKMRSELLRRQ